MGACDCVVLSAGKKPMPIKFLLLRGGGFWAFLEGGGGSANFSFMGVGIFPILRTLLRSKVLHDPLGVHPSFSCMKFSTWTSAWRTGCFESQHILPPSAVSSSRNKQQHLEIEHMELCPVALVTSPPGRAPREKDLCSLGSKEST